ncbi:cytochrome P450 [Favolaschia claudopus]|uniref:Cytochrome P450 n=1 Tax=Favolaschia claudopus TaxID=2862362 RepID=A0AAV9Z2K4_9AGAR
MVGTYVEGLIVLLQICCFYALVGSYQKRRKSQQISWWVGGERFTYVVDGPLVLIWLTSRPEFNNSAYSRLLRDFLTVFPSLNVSGLFVSLCSPSGRAVFNAGLTCRIKLPPHVVPCSFSSALSTAEGVPQGRIQRYADFRAGFDDYDRPDRSPRRRDYSFLHLRRHRAAFGTAIGLLGLDYIDGPKNSSFILGNFKEMDEDVYPDLKMAPPIRPVFKFKDLSVGEHYVGDIKAVTHIVSKSDIYERTPAIQASNASIMGHGILSAVGEEHRRHVSSSIDYFPPPNFGKPIFRNAETRPVLILCYRTPLSTRSANSWYDWNSSLRKACSSATYGTRELTTTSGRAEIEVQGWLRRLTLDIIGHAGFNYSFDSLESEGKPNELTTHSRRSSIPRMRTNMRRSALQGVSFQFSSSCPDQDGGSSKLPAPPCSPSAPASCLQPKPSCGASGEGKKGLDGKKDLLSSLLKANMSDSEAQRLNDGEVVGRQIPAFFVAGHETTSSALAWLLYELSENPSVQKKLREELLSVLTDSPTLDDLNALPYLECVVRESLRVHSPVLFNKRFAVRDDVVPLGKPFIGKDGKERDCIPIRKGQTFIFRWLAVNTDKSVWGEDADEFKPERWDNLLRLSAVSRESGATFSPSSRAHTTALDSVSLSPTILFVLLRAFEFEAKYPKGSVGILVTAGVAKPCVMGQKNGEGLELIVKAFSA